MGKGNCTLRLDITLARLETVILLTRKFFMNKKFINELLYLGY